MVIILVGILFGLNRFVTFQTVFFVHYILFAKYQDTLTLQPFGLAVLGKYDFVCLYKQDAYTINPYAFMPKMLR